MTNPTGSESLGFYFHPPVHPDDPGYPQLSIFIRPQPTGLHFDPQRASFTVVNPSGELETLEVEHPWESSLTHWRVTAGRVRMEDHRGKVMEAFSFGGDLSVQTTEGMTICSLESRAPIFHLTSLSSISVLFIQEIEVLLAERRAAWLEDPDVYEHRLARLDPFQLFHACLDTLRKRFKSLTQTGSAELDELARFINVTSREIHQDHHLGDVGFFLEEIL